MYGYPYSAAHFYIIFSPALELAQSRGWVVIVSDATWGVSAPRAYILQNILTQICYIFKSGSACIMFANGSECIFHARIEWKICISNSIDLHVQIDSVLYNVAKASSYVSLFCVRQSTIICWLNIVMAWLFYYMWGFQWENLSLVS